VGNITCVLWKISFSFQWYKNCENGQHLVKVITNYIMSCFYGPQCMNMHVGPEKVSFMSHMTHNRSFWRLSISRQPFALVLTTQTKQTGENTPKMQKLLVLGK